MQVALLVFVQLISVCLAVQLKVGIYNQIPDLNNDHLASYKELIEAGINNDGEGYTVDAVVDSKEYNPYGKLEIYLSSDGFDLIEMDTADLKTVVNKDLIIELPTSLPKRLLKSSVSAVIINRRAYAYPTLVCGNFIISLTPEFPNCNLRDGRSDHSLIQWRNVRHQFLANFHLLWNVFLVAK